MGFDDGTSKKLFPDQSVIRLYFTDDFNTRHNLEKFLKGMTYVESRLVGTVMFTNVNFEN